MAEITKKFSQSIPVQSSEIQRSLQESIKLSCSVDGSGVSSHNYKTSQIKFNLNLPSPAINGTISSPGKVPYSNLENIDGHNKKLAKNLSRSFDSFEPVIEERKNKKLARDLSRSFDNR
jgi:hypothetical protein